MVAKAVGLTYQQIQKYENGNDRVSAATLAKIAQDLRMPINTFFEGLFENEAPPNEANLLDREETYALIRIYYLLPVKVRKSIQHLLSSLGKSV